MFASSCENVFGAYNRILKGALAMDVIATVAVFALSIVTCASLCSVSPSAGGGPARIVVMSAPEQVVEVESLLQQQMVPVQIVQQYQQVPPQAQVYAQTFVVDDPKG